MIRPIDIKINAAHPELPLFEAATYVDSPSAVFIRGVPPACGNWAITKVYVSATYPDGSTRTIEAVYSAAGIWVATLPAPSVGGRTQNGFTISADGTTEAGDAVTGYVLGMGDFAVLSVAPIPNPGTVSWEVRYFDTPPTPAKKGDMAPVDGTLKFYDGTAWVPFVSLADYYNKTEANALLAAKLNKSGGTLTGPLSLTGDKKISFFDTSGTRELRIGIGADNCLIELYSYGELSYSWRTPYATGKFALTIDRATAGHLAALDAAGNLVDSGKAPADFAPATKTVTVTATETMLPPDCFPIRYTDGGATVELSADEVDFSSQFVLRVKGATPVIALATFALPSGGQTIADYSQYPDITFGGRAPTTGVWPAYLREGETYSETYPVVYGNDIATLAPLASPAFTGTPTAPTPTAQSGDTQVATKKYVDDAVAGGGGGGNLDYCLRVDPETGGIYYTTPDTNA